MPFRSVALAALLAASFSLTLVLDPSGARAYDCEEQVKQALTEHGIGQDEVQSVEVVRRSGGAKSASIYSLDAWVRLNSCSNGALVVNMTKYCMVQNVYTTGDCRIERMPAY